MATISISEQLSGVTIHSTATITEKSRKGTSVVLNVSFSSYLNESGHIGTGYSVKAIITAYNGTKEFKLKNTSSSWTGENQPKYTTSGTMTITVPATVTSIYLGFKLKFDGDDASKSSTLTISKVMASVTSVTAFSDTTNPTMYFSNPGGYKIKPYLNFYDKAGGTLLLSIYPDGMGETGASLSNPYTWALTPTQRNTIRNKLKTKTECYCAIGLYTYSGSTRLGYSSKGVTFTNNLAPPIFTDFSYEDIGGATIDENINTLDLTGNNQKIIKGYSKLKISISTPATAQKGATMSHYSINGIKYTYEENFEAEIDKWANQEIVVYAVDSRGISTKLPKTCILVNYEPLGKGTISVKRDGNIGVQTTLSYDGSFWNDNFGKVDNSIQASYKFRKTSDSSYTEGTTTINPTTPDNKFSFEDYILGDSSENGFDINDSYEIVVSVKDKLSEITYSSILGSGIPAIAIYKNNIAIHGKYDEELGGTQVYEDLFLNSQKIPEPNSITINKTGETAMSTSLNYYNIGCGNVVYQKGVNLFLSTTNNLETTPANVNCVEVGKNIKAVKVNANMQFANNNTTSDMYFTCLLYHLKVGQTIGTIVGRALTPTIPKEQYATASISPVTVPVEEGDKLYLRAYKSLANGIASVGEGVRTYLTVEAVE